MTTRLLPAPATALAVALAVACAPAREPGAPAPLAVTPPRATADAPVRVEIAGRDFAARVSADFNVSGGTGLDAGFSAWLEPSGAGSTVPLADVALTQRGTLVATVPAGLAAGSYRLVVSDPTGRTGALERAYRVLSSASAAARFEVVLGDTPKVGVLFPVTVTAVDAAGTVVEGFEGTVTLSDTAGALAAQAWGPLVRGRAAGRVAIATAVASDTLAVTDGAGRAGASATFSVAGGPPMAVAFASAPVTAAAGTCSAAIDLALRDGAGVDTVAPAAVAVALQTAPPGVALFADAGCTMQIIAVDVAAGASRASFHLRATAPGTVTVRALPAALPGAVQDETVTP